MGGFLGIGGASWKTDRSNTLTGFSELKNVFNYALPQAESSQAAGQGDLSAAGDYWKKLLSGNRATMQQAVAPETNAVAAQADARKRQQASMGTARGGGVAAANQQTDTDSMAKIDNLLFGARPEAAKETAKIGATEVADASSLLGIGETSASSLTDLSSKARAMDYKINQDMVGKVTSAIDNALMAVFA